MTHAVFAGLMLQFCRETYSSSSLSDVKHINMSSEWCDKVLQGSYSVFHPSAQAVGGTLMLVFFAAIGTGAGFLSALWGNGLLTTQLIRLRTLSHVLL